LQNIDYLDIIEGPHPKEEDSMRRPHNHGLHLMKSRHQKERLRKLPHGYHQILNAFKRTIRKERNI